MNLSEERNYLKLQETLDALGLTAKNRALADEYLDMLQPENPELLKKAEQQDFSGLESEPRKKTTDYVEHCTKRQKEDELGRFVRLVSAVGGSTAYYPLALHHWNCSAFEKYLLPEQCAAIDAECRVWRTSFLDYHSLQRLFDLGQKQPEVLYKARELCFHHFSNAKVLITAIYLNSVKPAGGLLKNLFGKGDSPEIRNAVQFLEADLLDSISNLFEAPSLLETEISALREFLDNDSLSGAVPSQIAVILKQHTASEYLLALLGGSAFLAMEHSKKLTSFLRLCLAADCGQTLSGCKKLAGESRYAKREDDLEALFPVSKAEYLKWSIKSEYRTAVTRIAQSNAALVHHIIPSCTPEEFNFLLECIQKTIPALYQELNTSYTKNFLETDATEIVENLSIGQAEAKAYLIGEGSLDSLYPFADTWQKTGSYGYRTARIIQRIQKGDRTFFKRALVLEALRLHGYIFTSCMLNFKNEDFENVSELTGIFRNAGLPLSYQLQAYDCIYSAFYSDKQKTAFLDRLVESLAKERDILENDLRTGAKNSTAVGRYLCIRVLDNFWQKEKDALLACALDSSKMVKELLIAVYASHKIWKPEILSLLASKKSQERELAVLVLKQWGAESFREELNAALEKEKSKNFRIFSNPAWASMNQKPELRHPVRKHSGKWRKRF